MKTDYVSAVLIALAFVTMANSVQAQTSSISGNIFADSDGDAKSDEDEEAAEGQRVKLYRILEDGTRELVTSVTTDENGNYSFGGLALGDYILVFEFTSGVVVETASVITLTSQEPNFVQQAIPRLDANYQEIYGNLGSGSPLPGSPVGAGTLDALGLRNPANVTGEEVSRFQP